MKTFCYARHLTDKNYSLFSKNFSDIILVQESRLDQHWQDSDLGRIVEKSNAGDQLVIGDCLDLNGISRHTEDDFVAQYEEPVEAGLLSLGKHINQLQKINPNSKLIWIFGNHDDRLRKFAKKFPAWRGIVDKPRKLLMAYGDCPRANEIKVVYLDDYEDDFQIGKMHFAHGFYAGKYPAAKTVEAYDQSVCVGHAHTMQMHTKNKRTNPRAGYCIGHLVARQARRYLKGSATRWMTGFGYLEYLKHGGNFTMHLLPIIDGGFIFAGKQYRSI